MSQSFRREPGDWTCSSCQEVNFKSRNACRRCSTTRHQASATNSTAGKNIHSQNEPRPGDWNCRFCNSHNFASRSACFQCKREKQGSRILDSSTKKPGDWVCRSCNNNNFASRTACRQCGQAKMVPMENDSPAQAAVKPGDWICQSCNNNNFASRTACRQCGRPNRIIIEPNPPAPAAVKPGDWKCSSCPEVNFGSRVVCRLCGAARPSTGNQPAQASKECVICMDHPIDSVITTCGHSAVCISCGVSITQCPICRNPFTQQQLIKVFNVH